MPIPKDALALINEQQRYEIVSLRIAGWPHELIANHMGLSRNHIAEVLAKELRARRQLADSAADDLRQLELSRLDEAVKALWPQLLDGRTRAIETFIKISERRCKLLGLDAPERQISVDLTSQLERLSQAELLQEAQRLGLPIPAEDAGEIPVLLPLPGEQPQEV